MTVRRLLAEMGSDELSEWMAFSSLEPFGSLREDNRSLFQAMASLKAMGGGDIDVESFFPHMNADWEPQTPEEQLEIVKAYARSWGAKVD